MAFLCITLAGGPNPAESIPKVPLLCGATLYPNLTSNVKQTNKLKLTLFRRVFSYFFFIQKHEGGVFLRETANV